MLQVKVLENGHVELKFKFPAETVSRGERIGSSSILSQWIRIYLPDIILTLNVPQRLSYREATKTLFSAEAFRFYHELEKILERFIIPIPLLCIEKMKVPTKKVDSECVVWFRESPHSPKHRTIVTIHTTVNVRLPEPIGVHQFYKFLNSLSQKFKEDAENHINKYLPYFLKDYEKHNKIFFNIQFKNNLDFEIHRYDFVPTDDVRKLSPFWNFSYTLEFVGCDEETVKRLISNVKRGGSLREKFSMMALILSSVGYKIVSFDGPEIRRASGIDSDRPETLLLKLSEWLKNTGG